MGLRRLSTRGKFTGLAALGPHSYDVTRYRPDWIVYSQPLGMYVAAGLHSFVVSEQRCPSERETHYRTHGAGSVK